MFHYRSLLRVTMQAKFRRPCAFGLRCLRKDCGFGHYDRIRAIEDEPLEWRMEIARLFDDELVKPKKLTLVRTADRKGVCCKFGLLCYERECKYRHPYDTNYDIDEDCRIEFKKILEKFLKAYLKQQKEAKANFEAELKKEIEERRDAKRVDWNDLDDDGTEPVKMEPLTGTFSRVKLLSDS